MDATNFVYWLQGFLELGDTGEGMTPEQVEIIKDHIALVFNKVTPERKPTTSPKQVELPPVGGTVLDLKPADLDPFKPLCTNVPLNDTPLKEGPPKSPFEMTPEQREKLHEAIKKVNEEQRKKPAVVRCAGHHGTWSRGQRYC